MAAEIVWTGRNELEIHQFLGCDRSVFWREDLQGYSVNGKMAYPGDRIIRTPSGFQCACLVCDPDNCKREDVAREGW